MLLYDSVQLVLTAQKPAVNQGTDSWLQLAQQQPTAPQRPCSKATKSRPVPKSITIKTIHRIPREPMQRMR